jgi:hypothetical protein
MARYKALEKCRFGGMFREAGDEFDMPDLPKTPQFLEKLTPAAAEKAEPPKVESTGNATVTESTGAMPADMGAGKPPMVGTPEAKAAMDAAQQAAKRK